MEGYQYGCEQWLKLEPDNDEVAQGLAGAYLNNVRPCLALRAFQNFLKKWPDHPRAPEARQTVSGLEEALPGMLTAAGLSEEDGYQSIAAARRDAVAHEPGQVCTGATSGRGGLAAQARLRSDAQQLERDRFHGRRYGTGDCHSAPCAGRQPDNIHALSNLIRYLCSIAQWDEARDAGAAT